MPATFSSQHEIVANSPEFSGSALVTMAPKKKETQSSHVFIKDEEYGWRPAVQEKISGGKAIVTVPEYKTEQSMQCDGGRNAKKGEQIEINLKDYPNGVLPLQNVNSNGDLNEYSDMVKLPYLHEVRAKSCVVGLFLSRSLPACHIDHV